MDRPAGCGQSRAACSGPVGRVQTQHPTQEAQGGDGDVVTHGGGLAGQDRHPHPGRPQSVVAGEEQTAIEGGRDRASIRRELRGEELRQVRFVPDRERVRVGPESPPHRGHERLVVAGAGVGEVVLGPGGRPAGNRPGDGDQQPHPARMDFVRELAVGAPCVRGGVGGVEPRRLARIRAGRHVLPVHRHADRIDAERLQLGQRLHADAVAAAQQLSRGLEGRELPGARHSRYGARAARAQQHERNERRADAATGPAHGYGTLRRRRTEMDGMLSLPFRGQRCQTGADSLPAPVLNASVARK